MEDKEKMRWGPVKTPYKHYSSTEADNNFTLSTNHIAIIRKLFEPDKLFEKRRRQLVFCTSTNKSK